MPSPKQVVDAITAAEVQPAPAAPEAKQARVVTFWSASQRKIELSSGEVEFKTNKLTLTDEKLINELLPMCGDKNRIWKQD